MRFHDSIKFLILLLHDKPKNSIEKLHDFDSNRSISVNKFRYDQLLTSLSIGYIVRAYQHTYEHILVIEYPLINDEYRSIVNDLERACTTITWSMDASE
jgi:hypothetical protein